MGPPAGPSVPGGKPTQKPVDTDAVRSTERERYIKCLKEVERAQSAGGRHDAEARRMICGLPPRKV